MSQENVEAFKRVNGYILALVTEIRDGKTISIRAYLDREEALQAVGLSEKPPAPRNKRTPAVTGALACAQGDSNSHPA